MLKIGQGQVDAFAKKKRDEFENATVAHVKEIFPEFVWDLSDDALIVRVRRDIDRARVYGLMREVDVAEFIDLTFELGSDFDSPNGQSWASTILRDAALDGSEKIRRIRAALDDLCDEAPDDEVEPIPSDDFPDLLP